MRLKFYFLFGFFTLLFLFYPGDSVYFHIFAYNRPLFEAKEKKLALKTNPVPYLKYQYYPEITAEGVYVVDLPSMTPLMERNTHLKMFPASTAKVLTALVAVDVYKLDDVVTVMNPFPEGQVMELVEGERITVENLLYGLLIQSGNDAAYALANSYGFDKYVALMNKKAEELKMNNSHFKNPAGLDDMEQFTTPFDLTLAARELLTNPFLRKVVSIKEIIISDINFENFHKLSNVNKLLGEIHGLGGLKTGYTEFAGENLVSFYTKSGHQYVIVVLKSEDRFEDTKNIVSWLNENIDYVNMIL
jgi:D-alanyl-D-alanine carboxypeptidase (penicillin-binding protein 5/6)